jgi:hypothetical protein
MRVMLLSICLSLSGCAMRPATRHLLTVNAGLFASSYVEARAAAYGNQQCRAEGLRDHGNLNYFGNIGGGHLHPYRYDLKITLPLDAGVSLLSFWLHKRHHDTLAVLLPVSSASAQFSSAALKYGAGCF